MAETAQRYLEKNPDCTLVILTGNGHIRHKYGIPERLYRRNQMPYTVIVQDEGIEKGIADYVLQTTTLKGKKAFRLGVNVEEKEQSVIVKGISGKSPAKEAGLQKGDVIKSFANQPIKSLADLKVALFYVKTDDILKIQIERDNEILNKELKF